MQSAEHYLDLLYKMWSIGKKQRCASDDVWASWQQTWSNPEYVRKREIMSRNRLNKTGGKGASPSRHTGGSISAAKIIEKLVFTFISTKDDDGVTFIDRRAELVRDNHTTGRESYCISDSDCRTHKALASRATPVEPEACTEEI
ncbi:hypothetical protein JCGZ_20150 [Jatropha curcas]|uniref:Uncharacterized protein n=1 Tax=Jatropha curcas TaxID=180498 RepID=A0A067K5G8_JATCU|nr:hypothetical protein JCGZ_20150 [Jatropha curcas]